MIGRHQGAVPNTDIQLMEIRLADLEHRADLADTYIHNAQNELKAIRRMQEYFKTRLRELKNAAAK